MLGVALIKGFLQRLYLVFSIEYQLSVISNRRAFDESQIQQSISPLPTTPPLPILPPNKSSQLRRSSTPEHLTPSISSDLLTTLKGCPARSSPQAYLAPHIRFQHPSRRAHSMEDSQTVLCGCPGGRNGNALASTTRSLLTPYTRALESTTAPTRGSVPIAPGTHHVNQSPGGNGVPVWTLGKDLHVALAW